MKTYMITEVIGFYVMYLKKICVNNESYLFVRDWNSRKNIDNVELITHGFKIINFMNFIL